MTHNDNCIVTTSQIQDVVIERLRDQLQSSTAATASTRTKARTSSTTHAPLHRNCTSSSDSGGGGEAEAEGDSVLLQASPEAASHGRTKIVRYSDES